MNTKANNVWCEGQADKMQLEGGGIVKDRQTKCNWRGRDCEGQADKMQLEEGGIVKDRQIKCNWRGRDCAWTESKHGKRLLCYTKIAPVS